MSYEPDNGTLRGRKLVDQILAEGEPEERELWGFVRRARAGELTTEDAAQLLQHAFCLGMAMGMRRRGQAGHAPPDAARSLRMDDVTDYPNGGA